MDLLELSKARYSCRKISDKPVEQEKLDRILATAVSAPTAKNNQPYKLWLIQSDEALELFKQACHFTFGARNVIVVGGNPSEAFVRPFDGKNFVDVDAAIVGTHIMLAIQAEGLASTWVGYIDTPKLKELFPGMADYEIVAAFPIGYAADDAKPSARHNERRSVEEVVETL